MIGNTDLIDQYAAGPEQLRQAVTGMTEAQLNAAPIPGKWSTRQVICHIADFEPVYADRMKRVIAVSEPTFFGGDPDVFAARLAYEHRDIDEELQLIEAVRRHMARILRSSVFRDDIAHVSHLAVRSRDVPAAPSLFKRAVVIDGERAGAKLRLAAGIHVN